MIDDLASQAVVARRAPKMPHLRLFRSIPQKGNDFGIAWLIMTFFVEEVYHSVSFIWLEWFCIMGTKRERATWIRLWISLV